jgi:hypothetical protein
MRSIIKRKIHEQSFSQRNSGKKQVSEQAENLKEVKLGISVCNITHTLWSTG